MTLLTAFLRAFRECHAFADPFFVVSDNQQLRQTVDHHREREQHQTQFDQRREVNVTGSFGELVGDHRRDRIAGRKQRGVNGGIVADHHRDRHGFAERAREGQKDRADDTQPRKRQHGLTSRFPLRRAQGQRGFALFARHRHEGFARNRDDEREGHDRENHARREVADSEDVAAEQNRAGTPQYRLDARARHNPASAEPA